MRAEFERDRIKALVTQLESEHEQLRHSIVRAERDEQFEIERIRREFKTRTNAMQLRQEAIKREIQGKKRDLERVEQRVKEAQGPQASAIDAAKARRLGKF